MEKRICRKCLNSIPEEEFFQHLQRYVDHLDESVRADDSLYKERLSCCERCSCLMNGVCRLCGCFVEMRAAIAVRRCPAAERYW
ncbi:DUF6171 family protein [Clostridium sp. Marseille-P2415]|uniref:DUF6171 family protein n=1 Tax=Clostridium sp. Marseille-P2415 TaxID=1805471 RepID=UPI0009883CD0|nr:DUF6171 family protein [Clostridium sp. Marseille-P2415]